MNCKKIMAILLSAAMVCTMVACGKDTDDEETIVIEDDTVYDVAVVRSDDNVYINMLDQGFIDALSDKIGAEHLNVSYIIYSEEDEKLLDEYKTALETQADAGGTAVAGDAVVVEPQTEETDAEELTEDEPSSETTETTATEDGTDTDTDETAAEDETAEQIAKSILADYDVNDYDLIYTIGIPALQTVETQTDTVPIVASGVVDYVSALDLTVTDEEWDYRTHTNVAGVQGLPPIDQQLSLMIEATPDLQAIGLLYKEGDVDAIYQNEVLETYLDQAGIPWKEYMIPETVEDPEDTEKATASRSEDEKNFYEMIFGKNEAVDAEQETPTESEELTEDTDTLAADEQVRQPRQSDLWDTYLNALLAVEAEDAKQQALAEEEAAAAEESGEQATEPEDNEETEEIVIKHPITELPEDATESDIVEMATSVCDMLYISAGSYLIDDMETIGDVALEHNTRTFCGDTTGGAYTLVSLYCDPYNMGYQAGKLAYKILVEEEAPGELKLSSPSASAVQKLYNGEIAEQFGMTFPKSFMEINEFNETYTPGSMTKREKAGQ